MVNPMLGPKNMARVQNPQFISSLVNCKPYKPRETPDFDRLNRGFYTFGEFDLCSSAPSSSEDKVSTELDDKEDDLLLLRNQILCLVFFLAEPTLWFFATASVFSDYLFGKISCLEFYLKSLLLVSLFLVILDEFPLFSFRV